MLAQQDPAALGAGLLAAGTAASVAAWLLDRRRRAYTDQPTTPAAAVFAGRNEVAGRAWAATPLHSHRTETPTVWWRYRLEEERTHTRTVTTRDAQGNSSTHTETYEQWHEIDAKEARLDAFEVVDATGSVPVRLPGARLHGRELLDRTFRAEDREQGWLRRLVDDRTGRYRETEDGIAIGDDLFVVGEAILDERTGTPLLGEGVLVSTGTEASRTGWLGAGVVLLTLLGLGSAAVGIALLVARGPQPGPRSLAVGLAVPVAALLVAWAVTTYNRLRLLAQAIDRAWSLVGVQLQRRHDLVPALAAAVTAHAAHERSLLEAVDLLRWDATGVRDPGQLSAEATEQTTQLRAVLARAEAYPELTADDSFLNLQRELADTESRVAGSRTFYNDTLTLLRDRAQTYPSALVARFVSLGHRELIPAEGFERTVPPVARPFA